MMRRIDLLPGAYAEKRRERRTVMIAALAGLVVLALLTGWYFLLRTDISNARDDLAEVQARNAQLQVQINELARFTNLEQEVEAKAGALQTIMAGDIAWPAVLTEIAMTVPSEVWLEGLTASAGATEGAAQVGTETAAIRINEGASVGRIQFEGLSLTMPGVAKWLIRLNTVDKFTAAWLTDAIREETNFIRFTNTIELSPKAQSRRFQEGGP